MGGAPPTNPWGGMGGYPGGGPPCIIGGWFGLGAYIPGGPGGGAGAPMTAPNGGGLDGCPNGMALLP